MVVKQEDEQIAAARYALIAPIVSRQTPLAPGELQQWLAKTADRLFELPGTRRHSVSARTLERYLAAYRKGGWDALKPKARKPEAPTKLPSELLQLAIKLRRERPQRSVEQLIFLLEQSGAAKPGQVAASTLARHLRKAGANCGELQKSAPSSEFRRFEAEDILTLVQSDFKHFIYLPIRCTQRRSARRFCLPYWTITAVISYMPKSTGTNSCRASRTA